MYNLKSVEDLIEKYLKLGGELIELVPGSLGYGLSVLVPGCSENDLKTFIIIEVYLNEWSSAHKVRAYRKTPEKYLKMIEKI